MNRWDQDGARGQPSRLAAAYASRPVRKWAGLFLAWVAIAGLLAAVHLTLVIWPVMLGLIGYVVLQILRETPPGGRSAPAAGSSAGLRLRFNPAPGWPEPPPGWTPPRGWQPHPSWPPAPPGWELWVPASERAVGVRTSRRYRQEDDSWDRRNHRWDPRQDDNWDGRDDSWDRRGNNSWNPRQDDSWDRRNHRWDAREDDSWDRRNHRSDRRDDSWDRRDNRWS